MKILHTVTVKQVLTEKSKQSLLNKYEQRKFQLKKECDHLKFELKKQQKTLKVPSQKLQLHFDKEIEERLEKIKVLDFQVEQLHILPLGSELKEREVQGIIEVSIGDTWSEETLSKTIIVKDGTITEIR